MRERLNKFCEFCTIFFRVLSRPVLTLNILPQQYHPILQYRARKLQFKNIYTLNSVEKKNRRKRMIFYGDILHLKSHEIFYKCFSRRMRNLQHAGIAKYFHLLSLSTILHFVILPQPKPEREYEERLRAEIFRWQAPELFHSYEPYRESDVYGLALLIWEMCTSKCVQLNIFFFFFCNVFE